MFEGLIEIIPVSPILIFKVFAGILLLLHLAFSIILVRQTKLMIRVIEAQISSVIYMISIIHLLFSFFVLVWVIVFI